MLTEIIKNAESEWLDFKEFFYSNNADLVHDILCMANVLQEESRFIVIGVSNDKSRIGLQPGTIYKTQADISQLLRSAQINRMPTIILHKEDLQNGKFLLGIEIKNRLDKPYFLLKEYMDQGKRVRQGAIYTRITDSNTPIDSTTPDHIVENMYRQRFGLQLKPKERFFKIISEVENWAHEDDNGLSIFRYEPDPSYYIEEVYQEDLKKFQEPWTFLFPDPNAFRYEYKVCYQWTKLMSYFDISCDGGRGCVAMPEIFSIYDQQKVHHRAFYLVDGQPKTLINDMMRNSHPHSDDSHIGKQITRFSSNSSAMTSLTNSFNKGAVSTKFYFYDNTTSKWSYLEQGAVNKLSY